MAAKDKSKKNFLFNLFAKSRGSKDQSRLQEKENSERVHKSQIQHAKLRCKLKRTEDEKDELYRQFEEYKAAAVRTQLEDKTINASLIEQMQDVISSHQLLGMLLKNQPIGPDLRAALDDECKRVEKIQEMMTYVVEGQAYIDQKLPEDILDLVENIARRIGNWQSLGMVLEVDGEALQLIDSWPQTHRNKVLSVVKAWVKQCGDAATAAALQDAISKIPPDAIKEKPISDDEMRIIRENSYFLTENLLAVPRICDEMYQSGFMDERSVNGITREKDARKRKLALIEVLPRLGEGCLKTFCDALEKTDNMECAKRLKCELPEQPSFEEIRDHGSDPDQYPNECISEEADAFRPDQGSESEKGKLQDAATIENSDTLTDSYQKLIFIMFKTFRPQFQSNIASKDPQNSQIKSLLEHIEVHRKIIEETTRIKPTTASGESKIYLSDDTVPTPYGNLF